MTSKKEILVRDVMTRKVIAVREDTPLLDAAKIISEHNFDGIPVIDSEDHLMGIVTEYDLITKTSSINMSFLQKVLNEVRSSKGISFNPEEQSISNMQVGDIMNREPLSLKETASFDDVIKTFIAHHKVNPIPIIDDQNKIVGIISRFDVLRPLNLMSYGMKSNNHK